MTREHARRRADRSGSAAGRQPRFVELVGLAGVGKSHLNEHLIAALSGRFWDLNEAGGKGHSLLSLGTAMARFAPLFAYIMRAPAGGLFAKLHCSLRLLHYAYREEEARRIVPPDGIVLSQEGWYHKLRKLRTFLGPRTSFADLPPSVRSRMFRADLVILLTADPGEICARKLRRKGEPVTPETIARQYDWSASLGQWDQLEQTRRDLDEAARLQGLEYLEIDYRAGFDVERDLLPRLAELGVV